MLARWRADLICLAGLLLMAAVLALAFSDHHLDPSFITYRVVHNLVEGRGFAFNPGDDPILHEAMSPLYALLLRLFFPLSPDIPALGNLVGALGIFGGALALYALARPTDMVTALIASALYLTSPLLWIALGLDVSVWTMLALLAVLFHVRGWIIPAGLCLGLSVLIRPEAGALAVILAADFIASGKPFRLWGLILFVSTLGAGWVWLIQTFSSIGTMPGAATISYAPLPADAAGSSVFTGLAALAAALLDVSPLWAGLLLTALPGAIRIKDQRWALLLVGWALLHLLALGTLKVAIYSWNLSPVIPALVALTALGITWIASLIKAPNISRAALVLLAFFAIAGPAYTLFQLATEPFSSSPHDALHPTPVDPAYQQAGIWVRDNTPRDARIAALHYGLLGYEADRVLLDFENQLQPGMDRVSILVPGDAFSWVVHTMPDVLVLRANEAHSMNDFDLAADPWFAGAYVEATRIAVAAQPSNPLVIYQRTIDPPVFSEILSGMVIISDDLTLNHIGTDFSLAPLESGRRGLVSIEWIAGPDLAGQQYVSLRIQSLSGEVIGLSTREIDFTHWPARKLITSYHWVDLAPAVNPGAYNIDVGLGPDPFEPEWFTAAHAKVPYENTVFLGAYSGTRIEFGEIALIGYRLAQTPEGLEVLLLWEATKIPLVNYRILVQVRDAQGNVAAHVETEPYGGNYPTSIWSAGEQVFDTVRLDVTSLPTGDYEIFIGVIAPDGTRLRTQDGRDAVMVGRVHRSVEQVEP